MKAEEGSAWWERARDSVFARAWGLGGDYLLGGVGCASAVVREMAIVLHTGLSVLRRRRSYNDGPPLLCCE